jgi:peptidoglycan lytic transglycosylase
VNAATPRQRFGQQSNSQLFPTTCRFLEVRSFKSALLVILVGSVLSMVSGCASRRPVAARQPPPDLSSTPETSSESAKSATTHTPVHSAAAAKRRRDNSIAVSAGYTEQGEASWYGVPFHGRQASNGEIYDMNKLTAAHRTLPFETMVRVTNEKNGKSTVVRITDRGPFVNNRIIDLSYAAAREIESIGPGVVPVRLEVLSTGIDPEAGFFTIQVGSFRERANAERLRERLSAAYSPTFVKRYNTNNGAFYRVQVGKVSGEEAAKEFGERLHSREGVTPMVIRLDDTFSEAGENK